MMPKVLSYLRVSTDMQDVSIEVQRDHCQAWFAAETAKGLEATYIGELEDVAVSGTTDLFGRPNGQYILTKLDRGDVLVVAKLSRAFRSTLDALQSMVAFRQMGIRLVVLDMNIDTSTPVGKMMITILAAVMEFERELIVERTREALTKRRAQGQWLSNKVPPGWDLITSKQRRSKDNALVVNELERAFALKALEMVGGGMSPEIVARNLRNEYRKRLGASHISMSKGDSPGQIRFSKDRIVNWCVYALFGFPKLTQAELTAEFGKSPFNMAFIRASYPEFSRGELDPL